MKQYTAILLLAISIVAFTSSCKKSNDAKDYTGIIKDKVWWGEITYTGKATEYYSVQFKADNTLLWSQYATDDAGEWTVSGKVLTITFNKSGIKVTADISDDNKLLNIVATTSAYKIGSGQMLANPATPFDNTAWKGAIQSITSDFRLLFAPGNQVGFLYDNTYPFVPYGYTRSLSGGCFRIGAGPGTLCFGVLTSATEIKGTFSGGNPWHTTKQ